MFETEEIKRLIQNSIPDAKIDIRDINGGGDHFEVEVQSSAFRSKNLVEQHRMIYQALGNAFDGAIHALKIKTSTL